MGTLGGRSNGTSLSCWGGHLYGGEEAVGEEAHASNNEAKGPSPILKNIR